ncbi:MAG: amidohydrolase [Bryobacteraceae bacterium]|jgi:aminobenzoyl-glutamate utilization protein B
MYLRLIVTFTSGMALAALAQPLSPHRQVEALVDQHNAEYAQTSRAIWEYAELGYHEDKSSALLQRHLKEAGFRIQAGVAGEPTAFVATYGDGSPVIGILGEFDALPGLSQNAVPDRSPVAAAAPGHGCGHNLLGSGAALAAVALKEYMEENHVPGTLRYYGTPAEESGDGKVYMVRAGLFRDVDVVLHWHPADRNSVINGGALAITSAKFLFHGVAAHAAFAPERGRSALDAVMLMGTGVEFMREHVPSNTRIHYTVSNGGAAPNIVPDTAELFLFARSPSLDTLDGIWGRILKIGQGAALMTETTLEVKILGSDNNIVANEALAKVAQKNLEEVGGFSYTVEEDHFAGELQKSLPPGGARDTGSTASIQPLRPFDPNEPAASTDVGDVSWNVPTIGFTAATFVPGVVPHTWQAAACAGMSIGQKGMLVAAKALAVTGADLLANPQLIQDARQDFTRQLAGKTYKSEIPAGQKPPLDYRF